MRARQRAAGLRQGKAWRSSAFLVGARRCDARPRRRRTDCLLAGFRSGSSNMLSHARTACAIVASVAALFALAGASSCRPASVNAAATSYLSQQRAKEVDAALMPSPGFSVESLMELSGLAVAASVVDFYPATRYSDVVAVLGPGGNGGDGMVAARHLASAGAHTTPQKIVGASRHACADVLLVCCRRLSRPRLLSDS